MLGKSGARHSRTMIINISVKDLFRYPIFRNHLIGHFSGSYEVKMIKVFNFLQMLLRLGEDI
eukprot:snap_masked-scaffold_24-processed-gene-5.1-mRNA-1 protein AED:1.00 eAED:1.00 QI:0/0/0/0/1/1/2/0/61